MYKPLICLHAVHYIEWHIIMNVCTVYILCVLLFFYIASNILIKRRCQCQDLLFCTCHQQQKAIIKLGKFSSLDITRGETVSDTAGDVWSFGCFLLETLLNKCEPLDIVVEEHIIEVNHVHVQ